MMNKIVPLDIENYGFHLGASSPRNRAVLTEDELELDLRKLFYDVEKEHPEYWWNGLLLENFNGSFDKIYALVYKNKVIGFVGITPRREVTELSSYERIPGEYISVALLKGYRGKGIAKKMVAEAIKNYEATSGYGKLKNPVWTAHEDNIQSQSLFKSLTEGNEYLKNLGIRLILKNKLNNFIDMSKDITNPTTVEEYLEFAKRAFVPAEKKAGAAGMPPQQGGMPPMDPSMAGGMPPMDPAMAGGMPPMDPSMAGGMPPMDPSMAGGMPPMDPSMAGGAPAPQGDPVGDLIPMLEEFGSTVQKQEQDIAALRQDITELRNAFTDLQSKYSQIAGQYSTIISIMQGGNLPEAPKL